MKSSNQTSARTEATPAEKHLSQRLLMVASPDAHFWQACSGDPWSSCQRDSDKTTCQRSQSSFGHQILMPSPRGGVPHSLQGTSASLISPRSSPRHRPKLHDDSTRPSRSLPAPAPPVVAAAPEQEEQYNDDEEGFHGGVAPFRIGSRARAVPVEKLHRQAETTAEGSPRRCRHRQYGKDCSGL